MENADKWILRFGDSQLFEYLLLELVDWLRLRARFRLHRLFSQLYLLVLALVQLIVVGQVNLYVLYVCHYNLII